MITNQICCDIAYNHSITVLRDLVVQGVDGAIQHLNNWGLVDR